ASGKPVVVQDTGPSEFLPNGEGMFRFTTPEEAARAFDAINADYEHHCAAARRLAEAYFDAKKTAAKILSHALGPDEPRRNGRESASHCSGNSDGSNRSWDVRPRISTRTTMCIGIRERCRTFSNSRASTTCRCGNTRPCGMSRNFTVNGTVRRTWSKSALRTWSRLSGRRSGTASPS